MLNLESHTAVVSSLTLLPEKHGPDETETGLCIAISTTLTGEQLAEFDKDLQKAMFRKQRTGDQTDVEFDNDGYIEPKFPRIKHYPWDEEFPGYDVSMIAAGLGLEDPLSVEDVKVKKFNFKAIKGGSVPTTFNIICHPDAEGIGAISQLLGKEIELTMTSPDKQ